MRESLLHMGLQSSLPKLYRAATATRRRRLVTAVAAVVIQPAGGGAKPATTDLLTQSGLESFARTQDCPIYWVGPQLRALTSDSPVVLTRIPQVLGSSPRFVAEP